MAFFQGVRHADHLFNNWDVNSTEYFPNFDFTMIWYMLPEGSLDEGTFVGEYFYGVLPFLRQDELYDKVLPPSIGGAFGTRYGIPLAPEDFGDERSFPNFEFLTEDPSFSGWYSDRPNSNMIRLKIIPGYMRGTFGTRYGKILTDSQFKTEGTFSNFEFGKIWGIPYENLPMILRPTNYKHGEPNTSRKYLTFLRDVTFVDSYTANIYYNKRLFEVDSVLSISNPVSGDEHDLDSIMWDYYGIGDSDGESIGVYLMNGIQDEAYQAQFGNYLTSTTRTAIFLPDRSNEVSFYYVGYLAVPYDYLMGVQTSGGVVRLAINKDNVTEIKCIMPNGEIGYVSLVSTEDITASPVHVQTPSGIKALQQVPESQYKTRNKHKE